MNTIPAPPAPTAQPALTVYKASAGSGKTFTLTVEYIKLLIENPLAARTILAVTFTNKATDEMKTRILSQLYGLSHHLPSSKSYLNKIISELWGENLETEQRSNLEQLVAKRAGIALSDILHHYSYFRIQTIDTFFQSVLRNLARELDLTANLRVELNSSQIEQRAVDEMIDQLQDNDKTLQWIMGYIKDKIDEERNWDVIKDIKQFGENIFKDFYKANSQRLNAVIHKPDFFADFNQRLRSLQAQAKQQISDLANRFFSVLDENLLDVSDFSRGEKGVCGYFLKLAKGEFGDDVVNATVKTAIESGDPYKWVKKTEKDKAAQQRKLQLVNEVLQDKLVRTEEQRKRASCIYKSATVTLNHIRQLYLLNTIERKVRQLNREANSFLLSDTQGLLHALIKDTDTPFIFEKIGTHISHIMIDEFQDTSTVQWSNFKVLLSECMSHASGGNLIVGDVKQSIYRWRSGDWRLLNSIEDEFASTGLSISQESLATNYRSMKRVIDFNNAFFRIARQLAFNNQKDNGTPHAEQLQRAYKDVVQQVPEGKPDDGYVSVELLADDDYEERMLARVAMTVKNLLGMGEKPSDICIIVRKNSHIQLLADYFLRNCPEVCVVSDEAFKLGKSLAVTMLVSALRLLSGTDDTPTKAFLAKAYQKHILGREITLATTEQLDALLPVDFVQQKEQLRTTPLHDLAERLFTIFSLHKLAGQTSYLHTFFDKLSDFILNNTADICDFVKEWDNSIHNESTQADSTFGIRLMTIHKSKGLECDNVVLPFCDWKLQEKSSLLWCSPSEAPFSELPMIPVDFTTNSLKGTVFEPDALEEQLQICVDNLNLLYVAFTRAKKRLFVMGKKSSKSNERSQLVEQSLFAEVEETSDIAEETQEPETKKISLGILLKGITITGDPKSKEDDIHLEYGNIGLDEQRQEIKADDGNVFLAQSKNISFPLRPSKSKAEFRQSNQSRDFLLTDDTESSDSEEHRQREYIQTGCVLHQLFSSIRTANDIDRAIRAMEADGTLQSCGLTHDRVSKLIHSRVTSPQAADWFSDRWTLFNECTILAPGEGTDECYAQRPDRVMTDGQRIIIVDFKFGTPHRSYLDQVRRYMNLIREMDMGLPVEGYLWFVYTNNIIPVE